MIHRLPLDERPAAWQRAVERAIANGYERRVTFDAAARVNGFEVDFVVRSASRPGREYFVQLLVTDGKREAICDCIAGSRGVICWHAAAAALIAGMLTLPEPEPDPEPVEAMKKLGSSDFTVTDILSGAYREALVAGSLS